MMVLSTAPCRIGLFGGGTDVNPYAEKYGGVCINLAINLYQTVVLGGYNLLLDSDSEEFFDKFTNYPVFHDKDMPAESGLGSSASLAVALLGAVNKLDQKSWTRDQIAEKAWDIEVNKLGLFGGKQDQYASVYGGMNLWKFGKEVIRYSIPRSIAEDFSKHILLFYSGENRTNTKIQEELKELTDSQKIALNNIKSMANDVYHFLQIREYRNIGVLLRASWDQKKLSNPKATNERLDEIHKTFIDAGAWGSKTSGSGGGGFCFCITPPDKQDKIITKMESIGCVHYDFNPCFNGLQVRKLP